MIGFALFLLLLGVIAAFVARVLVPGGPMSFGQTVLLGVVGSVVGGLLGSAIFKTGEGLMFSRSGVIGSICGAIVVVLFFRVVGARRHKVHEYSRPS